MAVNEHDLKYFPAYAMVVGAVSTLSKAVRKQVGALLVTADGVMIPSWNGTIRGSCNACEDEEGLTKPTVIHAEMGVLKKALIAGVPVKDSIMFCTHSPCVNCAVQLTDIGLKAFYYGEPYRDTTGIDILKESGVVVMSYDDAIMNGLS